MPDADQDNRPSDETAFRAGSALRPKHRLHLCERSGFIVHIGGGLNGHDRLPGHEVRLGFPLRPVTHSIAKENEGPRARLAPTPYSRQGNKGQSEAGAASAKTLNQTPTHWGPWPADCQAALNQNQPRHHETVPIHTLVYLTLPRGSLDYKLGNSSSSLHPSYATYATQGHQGN